MNIVIDEKYRVLSDGLGYSVKEITGEKDGKEVTKLQGHFITLAGCVKRIFQLGHAGADIDSVAALIDQMESQAARLEAFLTQSVIQISPDIDIDALMGAASQHRGEVILPGDSEFD